MDKKNTYVFFCGVVGLVVCLAQWAFFTGNSLVESILFTGALLFFVFKYWGDAIKRKQSAKGYVPSGGQKFKDQLWLAVCFKIGQPVCISFLYACSFLLLLKWLFPSSADVLANLIYQVNRLNEEHLQSILYILLTVLAGMTILEYISSKYFSTTHKMVSRLSYLFRAVAVMACFVHADTGISHKAINWKMNSSAINTEDKVTFNFSDGRRDTINRISDLYVDIIADSLFKLRDAAADTGITISKDSLYANTSEMAAHNSRYPFILTDIDSVNAPGYKPFDEETEEKFAVDSFFAIAAINTPVEPGAPAGGQYYNAAISASPEALGDILSILSDEEQSIDHGGDHIDKAMFKDVLKGLFGQAFGTGGIGGQIPLMNTIKETVADYLDEKLADGLFYLFKREKVTKTDVNEAEIFGIEKTKGPMPPVTGKINFYTKTINNFAWFYNLAYQKYRKDIYLAKHRPNIKNLAQLFLDFPSYYNEALHNKMDYWVESHSTDEINNVSDDSRINNLLLTEKTQPTIPYDKPIDWHEPPVYILPVYPPPIPFKPVDLPRPVEYVPHGY